MKMIKRILGLKREEVWRPLATELGGDYISGGFWHGDKVVVRRGSWTVTLDLLREIVSNGKTRQVLRHTRLRARTPNPDRLRFRISPRDRFNEALPGTMEQLETGDAVFDQRFLVHGTDAERLRTCLRNPRVRELLASAPKGVLRLDRPERRGGTGVVRKGDELVFLSPGVVRDLQALKAVFELFWELLEIVGQD